MTRILALAAMALPTSALAAGGSGTSGDPYQIETCAELAAVSNDLDAAYVLTAHIDCDVAPYDTGVGFPPIGNTTTRFTGHFDGAGFSISNLYIAPASGNAGLFAEVGSAVIENVDLINTTAIATGSRRVGTLIGNVLGTVPGGHTIIRNVSATGTATVPVGRAGGLIGQAAYIKVSDVIVDVDVSGRDAGGFISHNSDNLSGPLDPNHTFTRCAALGDVQGEYSAGGFADYAFRSHISESYATGSVHVTDLSRGLAGGLLAESHRSTFTDVYADNLVTADRTTHASALIAGPIGDLTITNAYATGGPGAEAAGLFVYLDFESEAGSYTGTGVVHIPQSDIDDSSADIYFSSSTSPLDTWDFTTVWASDGASFPTLQQTPSLPDGPGPAGIVCDEGSPYDWDDDGEDDGCLGLNATIDPAIHIPAGSRIGDDVTLERGVQLGTDVVIGSGVFIGARATLGDGNTIGAGAVISRQATLGDDNTIGDDSVIGRSATVGNNTSIGAMSSIGYGATLGSDATVTGSLVLGSLAQLGNLGSGNVQVSGGITLARSARVAIDAPGTFTAGDGVVVGPDSTIGTGSDLGAGVRLRKQATLGSGNVIGAGARIGRGVVTGPGVQLDGTANVSANVELCDDSAPFSGSIPRTFSDPACGGP